MRAHFSLAFLVGVAAGVAGCGSSYGCTDLCKDSWTCSSATQDSCGLWCEAVDGENDASSCTATFDELLTCGAAHRQMECGTIGGSACAAAFSAWDACLSAYCQAHPDGAGCVHA